MMPRAWREKMGWTSASARLLFCVYFGMVVLRLMWLAWCWSHYPHLLQTPDSPTYIQPAEALLRDGRFSVAPGSAEPEIIRTPGYPLFLAAHFALFGSAAWPPLLTQVLLNSLAALLVYELARRLGGGWAALFALMLYVLDLNSHYAALMLTTEAMFTTLLLSGLFALLPVVQPPTMGRSNGISHLRVGVAAVLFCAATWMRPITYFALPVLGAALVFVMWRRAGLALAIRTGLAWGLPVVVLIGGWQLRNLAVAGYSGFSAIQSTNLLFYRAGGVVMYRDQIDFAQAQARLREQVRPYAGLPPAQRLAQWDALAKSILIAHPGLVARGMLLGLKKMLYYADDGMVWVLLTGTIPQLDIYSTFTSLNWREYYQLWFVEQPRRAAISFFCAAHLYLSLALAAWAALRLIRRPHSRLAVLLVGGLLVYQLLISAGPEAYTRFRIPIAPLLYVLAGCGLMEFRREGNQKKRLPQLT